LKKNRCITPGLSGVANYLRKKSGVKDQPDLAEAYRRCGHAPVGGAEIVEVGSADGTQRRGYSDFSDVNQLQRTSLQQITALQPHSARGQFIPHFGLPWREPAKSRLLRQNLIWRICAEYGV
jgi:hypothetical protein